MLRHFVHSEPVKMPPSPPSKTSLLLFLSLRMLGTFATSLVWLLVEVASVGGF